MSLAKRLAEFAALREASPKDLCSSEPNSRVGRSSILGRKVGYDAFFWTYRPAAEAPLRRLPWFRWRGGLSARSRYGLAEI